MRSGLVLAAALALSACAQPGALPASPVQAGPGVTILCGRFEGFDGRTGGQEVALERLHHSSDVVVINGLTAVGEEGCGQTNPHSSPRRRGPRFFQPDSVLS